MSGSPQVSFVPETSPAGHLRLLIVEDVAEDAELIQLVLEEAGVQYTCQVTETVQGCLDLLQTEKWDAVLSDFRLIGATAYQVLEGIQQLQLDIPLILVTGTLGEEAAVECIKAGITDYVLKDRLARLPMSLERSLREFELRRQQKAAMLQIQQQAAREVMVSRIVQAISGTLALDEVLQTTADSLHEVLNVDRCLIFLPDDSGRMACHYSSRKISSRGKMIGVQCGLFEYYVDQLAQGIQVCLNQIDNHQPLIVQQIAQQFQVRAFLMTPLIYQAEYLGGVCLQQCDRDRVWTEDEVAMVKAVADQCAIALYNAQSYERLEAIVHQRTQDLEREKHLSDAANRAKSEFLANMSHELRTPLTSILGFSSVLLQQVFGSLNEKQEQYLKSIYASGEHLLELINDLLDLSKIEAGREDLQLELIQIAELCQSSVEFIREHAENKGLQVSINLSPEVDTCIGDRRRLRQILVNLLSNAVKFTESGAIALSVQHANQHVQFTVSDTGIGIAETDLSLLFQPFQQLESGLDRKYQGTGLGLALAQKLAQLHEGTITVTSELGKGSCFTLSLPPSLAKSEQVTGSLRSS